MVFSLLAGMTAISPCAGILAEQADTVFTEAAKNITPDCTFLVSENTENRSKLTDSSLSTNWEASADAFIEMDSPLRIGSLYIEWTAPPAAWTLSVWDKDRFVFYKTGENGFFNEFISLDGLYKKIRIHWEKQDTKVSIGRITAFSEGKVPDDIQQWKPPCDKADLLAVSTHADDEHLYFGGTLSTYAGDQGKKVQVAYIINCGTLRTRELLAGLWVVGVKNYPAISDFPDQYVASLDDAVKFYGYQKVLEYQVMLLRRFRPEVVVGQDLMGEYGHGAHMLNAKTLTEAIGAANDPLQFADTAEKYGIWEIKKCYLHLFKENPVTMDWTLPLAAFDGKSSWEMAKEGYDKHVSQHQYKFRVRIEGPNDCRQFGLYYTAVGADVLKNDFFENIPSAPVSVAPSNSGADSRSEAAGSSSEIEDSNALSRSGLSGSADSKEESGKMAAIGIGAVSVVFLVLFLYLLFIRRKQKKIRIVHLK